MKLKGQLNGHEKLPVGLLVAMEIHDRNDENDQSLYSQQLMQFNKQLETCGILVHL